jgi:hypothetical protein
MTMMFAEVPRLGKAAHPCKTNDAIVAKDRLREAELRGGFPAVSSPHPNRNINAIFLMLGWARCASHKKQVGARYAKLVFLHQV